MAEILRTDRISLRHFAPSDLDDLARLYADPEARRYFPEGPLSRAQTEEELLWFVNGGDPNFPGCVLYAAIELRSGALIGRGGFVHWRIEETSEVEIAYLLDKAVWRRGLGSEMASALLEYGFSSLGLERLIALIDPLNLASIATARKIGMRRERGIVDAFGPCDVFAIAAADHRATATTRAG